MKQDHWSLCNGLREGRFSSAAHDKLASGTIRNSISDISATFRENGWKKDKKNDATTIMASHNVTLCPVQAAAAIVRRIKTYPGANQDTPISAVWRYNQIKHITSTQIRNVLWDAVKAIREDTLHILVDKIGTHSIRSGAAMVMFLGGCPVFLIMMIGRWSSDPFLQYICKQIEEFNHDILQKMLTHMFHRHIPDYLSPTVSHLDPRQHNHPDNAETRINVGGGDGSSSQVACFCPVPLSTTSTIKRQEIIHITLSILRTNPSVLWRLECGKW